MQPQTHSTASQTNASDSQSVKQIIVRQSAFDNEDPGVIVQANVNFVNYLFESHYLIDEIPANALRSYHVDYYLAQVANGGHGQFVGNSGWKPRVIQDIAEGLRATEAGPYIEIFDDLHKLIESDPERAQAIADGRGFGKIDPAIEELDKRFYENKHYDTLMSANARWLRSLPELSVAPDAQYASVMQMLRAGNPLKDERAAQSHEHALGFALADPHKVAAKLLCLKASCLPVNSFGAGDPALPAPDGRTGIAWGVQASGKPFVMFLFDDVALLCEQYLADGRKVTNQLLAETRQQLFSGSLDAASWGHLTTREVARVSRAEVNNAIETAKSLPVQEAAQKLVAKLNPEEALQEIFAARRQDSGEWLWMVITDQRAGVLLIGSEGARLFDMEKQPLAEISMAEITGGNGRSSGRPDQGRMNAKQERSLRIDDETQEIFLRSLPKQAVHYGLLLSTLLLFVVRHESAVQKGILSAAIGGLFIYMLYVMYPAYKEVVKVKAVSADARWLLNRLSFPKLAAWFLIGGLIGTAFMLGIIVTSGWFKSSLGGVPYVSVFGFNVYATAMIFIPLLIAAIWGTNVGTARWAQRQMRLRERTGR